MTPKDVAKRLARALGLEVRAIRPANSQTAQLKAMLASHAVNLVFDVGANVGQFGRELRWHVGYRGRIVSFEPMHAAHAGLTKAAARDPLWEVAARAAVGSNPGIITINVAQNSVSSSVLPMLESHVSAHPPSRYGGTETAPVVRLDELAPQYLRPDSVAFLKIDTQGYESEVLRGATDTLERVVGVQLELSLVPLYAGQQLMPELIEFMQRAGFELWAIAPAFADPQSGRMLQVDATFFRAGASASRPAPEQR
jgi:FkbM family methyltransferase